MASTAPDTSRCRGGHIPGHPAQHPRWGQVPSASSVVIGMVGFAVILAICWIWLPGLFWPLIALLVVGLIVSAAVQALLGHRGACWAQRTVRWWLGPVGTLIDPLGIG